MNNLVRRISTTTVRPSLAFVRRALSTTPDLDNTLIVTNSCAKRIKYLQDKSNDPSLQLRVLVDGGGCSGFQYRFEMQPEATEEDDTVFTKNGTRVVVDNASFDLIKGSTVDYVQEMIKSSFAVVNNPQSVSSCGCGSSFALKNFAANPAAH